MNEEFEPGETVEHVVHKGLTTVIESSVTISDGVMSYRCSWMHEGTSHVAEFAAVNLRRKMPRKRGGSTKITGFG